MGLGLRFCGPRTEAGEGRLSASLPWRRSGKRGLRGLEWHTNCRPLGDCTTRSSAAGSCCSKRGRLRLEATATQASPSQGKLTGLWKAWCNSEMKSGLTLRSFPVAYRQCHIHGGRLASFESKDDMEAIWKVLTNARVNVEVG